LFSMSAENLDDDRADRSSPRKERSARAVPTPEVERGPLPQ